MLYLTCLPLKHGCTAQNTTFSIKLGGNQHAVATNIVTRHFMD